MATILLAASDKATGMVDRIFLATYGYDVRTVYGGFECVQKLRESPPDLLVLDRELPWGGADGVLAWLREDGSAPELPVIVLSSASSDGSGDFLFPPIVGILPKPALRMVLLDTVKAALEGAAAAGGLKPKAVGQIPSCGH